MSSAVRFAPQHGIYALLVFGAGAIAPMELERGQTEQAEKDAFLEVCEQDYEADWCAGQLVDHDQCFARKFEHRTDGVRRSKGYGVFMVKRYQTCLLDG